MDDIKTTEDIEREIEATMRERGIDYGEAEIVVGLKYGELHNDLLYMRPLTDEQRRRHKRTLLEVMAELGELDEEFELPGESDDAAIHGRGGRVAD
jgi:hypothetical protein